MRIGVISDTHNLFDRKIPAVLAGVSHILHAGDIGTPLILRELQQIAPVTAVSGNTDDPGFGYRETQWIEFDGNKFLLHHIVDPHSLSDQLKSLLARGRPDVVVFGHTHKPFSERIGGILFFNPGAAGKSRFGLARTLAILNCGNKNIQWEYHSL
jgi:putative phosphoesterase